MFMVKGIQPPTADTRPSPAATEEDSPPRGRWLRNVMLSIASVLLTLVALEVGLRVWGFDPFADVGKSREAMIRPSASHDLQYEMTPGAKGWAWGTRVSVNSEGFRGPEPSLRAGEGHRIEVLGDSIAFGNQLPAGDEFSRLLEKRMRKAGTDTEVLNLAVGGYDVVQDVASFIEKGLKYHPDVVVLTYCLNDAGIASPNLDYVHRLKRYGTTLWSHLRLYQFVRVQLDRIKLGEYVRTQNEPAVFRQTYHDRIDAIGEDEKELRSLMESAAAKPFPSSWYASEDRVGRIRYSFRRLRSASEAAGVKVIVMIVPWLEEEDGRYPHRVAHEIVAHEARRVGFDVLDLTTEFLQRGMESLRISSADHCHPNAEGHRIITEALLSRIKPVLAQPAGR
jgi:lysophospholipase L1-like esterase